MPRPDGSFEPRDARTTGRREGAPGPDAGAGCSPARSIVCARLASQAERFPDLDPAPLDAERLPGPDGALAHAIYDACVRRWLTLEAVLGARLDRPVRSLEPGARAALLCGAAQLLFLDRVPAHAAVHESVQWAKRWVRPGASGLVNAVLRRVAEMRLTDASGACVKRAAWGGGRDELPLSSGGALALRDEVLSADEAERVAQATSTPGWLLARWAREHGPERARALAHHGLATAPVVLNVEAAAPGLADRVPAGLIGPHEAPGHAVFEGSRADLTTLLSREPGVWVQDAGSGDAVRAARQAVRGRPEPAVVIDACAGRGTKTRQLAHAFPHSRIIASDVDAARLSDLRRAFAGRSRVEAVAGEDLPGAGEGRGDLVLLDVPCSNTGVLARRGEARYRFDASALTRLRETQRRIIDLGVRLLAPGGLLVYSTCSLEREENDEQAAWAMARHGLRALRGGSGLPSGEPGGPPGAYRDGSFWVVLAR